MAVTLTLNLYDPKWLERRKAAPPWQPIAVLGGAALLAVAVAGWNLWQRTQLTTRLAELKEEMRSLDAESDPAGERSAALAALAEAAQRREQTVAQWRGLDAASTSGQGAGGAPASQWFTALGAVVVDSVWLTRVQVDVAGALRLEGVATDGVALSDYLERWRGETLLAGIALQTLEMRRAGDAAGRTAAPDAESGLRTAADTSLSFTLSNLAAGRFPGAPDPAALPGGAARAAPAGAVASGMDKTAP